MNHFTDGEWSLRLWRDADLVPRGHWKCKLVRVCRCSIIWIRPESQRWDRKLSTELNGEPWNTSPRQEEKPQIKDRGGHCPKTFDQGWRSERKHGVLRACWIKSAGLRARTQDIVDNEVVQTDDQRKFERIKRNPPNSLSKAPCKAQLVAQRWLRVDPRWKTAARGCCSCGKCNDTINDEFNDSGGGTVQHRMPQGAGRHIRSARKHCVWSDRSDNRSRRS